MVRGRIYRFLRRISVRNCNLPGRSGRIKRIILILLLVFIVSACIMVRIEPEMRRMAEEMISTSVTEYLNSTIAEKIKNGELDYSSLVTLEKDSQGRVTALVTNMAKINVLQTEIVDEALEKLSDKMETYIKIPIGNIIGGTMLSGRGPNIPVKVISVSNLSAEFSNEFSAEGINQTRHQIILNFKVDISMLIPGSTVHDTVCASVVAAETVIVGEVPNAYTDIHGSLKN